MRRFILMALALALPAPCFAEVAVTPYVGRTFSGDATEEAMQYGGALSFGGGLVGFEIDGSYTPDFFGKAPAFSSSTIERNNNVTTLMGNVIVGPTFGDGRGRVYVVGGVGLIKTRVEDADAFFDVDSNDFGVDAGAGLAYYFGERVGLRGDVRWFRDLRDPEADNEFDVELGSFDYWRGAVGLSFRF